MEVISNPGHAGPQLTAVRKALTSMLSAQAALKQRPIQEAESAQLLYELITKPQVCYTILLSWIPVSYCTRSYKCPSGVIPTR